jgi:hypothetical protein
MLLEYWENNRSKFIMKSKDGAKKQQPVKRSSSKVVIGWGAENLITENT